MKHYHKILLLLIALCLSACSGNTGDNNATLQAEQIAFGLEATQIAVTLRAQGTQVMATAAVAETYAVNMEGINRQLAATRRALIPPTQQLVNS